MNKSNIKERHQLIRLAKLNNRASDVLVVGESHYLFDKKIEDVDTSNFNEDWFHMQDEDFSEKYNFDDEHQAWIDTQGGFEGVYDEYKKGTPTRRPKKIMWITGRALASLEDDNFNSLNDKNQKVKIADNMKKYDFMNFYQRPELKTGKSINSKEVDNEIAWENFKKVVEENNYRKIVVLSKRVGNLIQHKLEEEQISIHNIGYFTHPAYVRQWGYYRPDNDYAKLIDFLQK